MQANPDKFQVLAVGKKTFEKSPSMQIQNSNLSCETVVKLLGIDIDYQLNFDLHISNLCRKASQQLNILKRLRPFLSKLNTLTIFYAFILSNFNVCPLAWHFCKDKNTNKIEKVQEKTLCCVYNDYNSTYLELVEKAKVPTLQVHRIRTMALETFTIINNLSPTCLNSFVKSKTSKYSFRYSNILDLPKVRTSTYGKKSFKFAAVSL